MSQTEMTVTPSGGAQYKAPPRSLEQFTINLAGRRLVRIIIGTYPWSPTQRCTIGCWNQQAGFTHAHLFQWLSNSCHVRISRALGFRGCVFGSRDNLEIDPQQ